MVNHEISKPSNYSHDYLSSDIFYHGDIRPTIQKSPSIIAKHIVELKFVEVALAPQVDFDEVNQREIFDNAVASGQAKELYFTHPSTAKTGTDKSPQPTYKGIFISPHQ